MVGLFEIVGWAVSCHITTQRFWVGESKPIQLQLTLNQLVHKLKLIYWNFGHMLMANETITKELQQTSII